jgi:hypothetical protein
LHKRIAAQLDNHKINQTSVTKLYFYMKKLFFFSVMLSCATFCLAQDAKPTPQPLQCVKASWDPNIPDPKPERKNTGNAEMDDLTYKKALTAWTERNTPKQSEVQPVVEYAPVAAATLQETPQQTEQNSDVIDIIPVLVEKGIATREQVLAVAPNIPQKVNCKDIEEYKQRLEAWTGNYPRELEALYNKIISLEKLQAIADEYFAHNAR